MISAHGSGLDELARDLQAAADAVGEQAGRITGRGALNIKRDWARRWSGLRHAPHIPRAISYDVEVHGLRVSAEIGPDKTRPQGPLGNLLEYGSINNAPIPGGAPALEAERPAYERHLADLAERLLGG